MTKDDVIKLVSLVEKQTVGLLLARGLVNLKENTNNLSKDYKFNNLDLSKTAEIAFNKKSRSITITKSWLVEYIRVKNPSYKPKNDNITITEEAIIKKIGKYIKRNPEVTLDKILEAYRVCVRELGTYARKPEYFIYKKVGDVVVSQLDEYINVMNIQKDMSDVL